MNSYQAMPKADAGLPVTCARFDTSFPVRFGIEPRAARITGDTRRRKRRLRKKLERLDSVRYAPAIRAVAAGIRLAVMGKIEDELNASILHRRGIGGIL